MEEAEVLETATRLSIGDRIRGRCGPYGFRMFRICPPPRTIQLGVSMLLRSLQRRCKHSVVRFLGAPLWVVGVLILSCPDAYADGASAAYYPTDIGHEEFVDLTEAALLASGYERPRVRQRARETLERWVGPLVRSLSQAGNERVRAEHLLVALHRKGGLLGRYDMRATTLKDILENRRYNCVSASVLYNLVAHRAGLAVGAQLLPTHARSLLLAQQDDRLERIVIETTSENGFAPSPEEEEAILAQVAAARSPGGRSLVSDEGAVVSSRVLVSTIYVNRASIAQEQGNYELAERLFARGEAFVANEQMGRLLREQRVALLSQLAADDLMSNDDARFPRAYRTLLAAGRLGPTDSEIQAVLQHNLRAAAERVVSERADRRGEAQVWPAVEEASALLAPLHQKGLYAFAWSEVGRLRVEAERYRAAVEAYDRGIHLTVDVPDDPLAATLIKNRIAALRLAAFRAAKRGRYKQGWALIERAAATQGIARADMRRLEEDARRVVHLAAGHHIDNRDFGAAFRVYQVGLERFPDDETARHNLVAVLERRIGALTDKDGDCVRAEPHLKKLEATDPKSAFVRGTWIRCWLGRAQRRLKLRDFEGARALIERAMVLEPRDPTLRRNLAVALASWIRFVAERGSCSRAHELAAELEGLSIPNVGGPTVRTALSRCRSGLTGRR